MADPRDLIPKPNSQDLGSRYGLATSLSDPIAQQQLSALNAYARQKQQSAMTGINHAEQSMYNAIGIQQQQLESDIRKRRQSALKTGSNSAQLAAQELQTLLAAQQGAQMYADQYNQQRMQTQDMYAGSEQQNMLNVLGMVQQNNMGLANVGVQEYVGESSYRAQAMGVVDQAFTIAEKEGVDFKTALNYVMGHSKELKGSKTTFSEGAGSLSLPSNTSPTDITGYIGQIDNLIKGYKK